MHCQTTLEQLTELLSQDDATVEDLSGPLRQHIGHCGDCRRRLDSLTEDQALSRAAQRLIDSEPDTNSMVLRRALAAVDAPTTAAHGLDGR